MKTALELRAERERVAEQRDALDRRLHEIDAAIDEINGNALSADWHRLAAAGDPGEHAAWIRLMAEHQLRSGQPPALGEHSDEWRRQIAAEAERLRSSEVTGGTAPGRAASPGNSPRGNEAEVSEVGGAPGALGTPSTGSSE